MNFIKKNLNYNIKKFIIEDNKFKDIYQDIFDGGKRLRPMISILTLKSFLKKLNIKKNEELFSDDVEKVFLVNEIIHNISLILDDLPCMDNDNIGEVRKLFILNMDVIQH